MTRQAKILDMDDPDDGKLGGFLAGNLLRRANALRHLKRQGIRMGGRLRPSIDVMLEWADRGELATGTDEFPAMQVPKRWNAMTQDEQDEWERRAEKAGSKTVYKVMHKGTDGYWDIGKTGYDFANYLIGKQP